MKTFWWFREGAIAGMGRPGFNSARWFEFPFAQGVMLGWVGKYSCGRVSLEDFRHHLDTYAPQLFRYYNLNHEQGTAAISPLYDAHFFAETLKGLNERLNIIDSFEVSSDELIFSLNKNQLKNEIAFLQKNEIKTIVTLTEDHHQRDELSNHFETHHISINDLGAPTVEQVMQLKNVLDDSYSSQKRTAVHCLAGIGRTSTMIIAAHMLRGEKLEELYAEIKRTNPVFVPSPAQDQFLKTFKTLVPHAR